MTEVSMGVDKDRDPERIAVDGAEHRIVTIPRYCKGCGICVSFCPESVLEIKTFKINVARIENCIGCMQCELRCPDFAIEVHGAGKKGSRQ